ncbi:MAG: methyl-accepting chemotaxis protein [Lachnospiraceae bacterium]|nr:methyl-accepting chemotaxis protein [Lachnospiraceae bacterium]
MKSIKKTLMAVIIGCSLFSVLICGIFGVVKSMETVENKATEILSLETKNEALELNEKLNQISQTVDTLAANCMRSLTDYGSFCAEDKFVKQYVYKINNIVKEAADSTESAMTCYVRFNPELAYPTSGLFLTRDSLGDAFASETPTDLSVYDPSDLEHVGWYYIPVNKGVPTWMDPYLNENINVYMISYVVPTFTSGASFGIVGMDIDFSAFQQNFAEKKLFDTGYLVLVSSEDKVLYHPNLDENVVLSEDTVYGGAQLAAVVSDPEKNGVVERIKIGSTDYFTCYYMLDNGMKVISVVPYNEVIADAQSTAMAILMAGIVALAVSVCLSIVFARRIARPITNVTEAVNKLAKLNFSDNSEIEKLGKRKDETGKMAAAVSEMNGVIKCIVGDLNMASSEISESIQSLSNTSGVVERISTDNSATTEELTASMHETSASTQVIAQKVSAVSEVSESLHELSKQGKEDASKVKDRAVSMQEKAALVTSETENLYNEVKERTDRAIEAAKAVDKIKAMTDSISEISSQTNLLSLNASIEAARAGDAGRGFAVVASEIGNLANQTINTTADINQIVSEVTGAVDSMTACLRDTIDFMGETVLKNFAELGQVGTQYAEDAALFEDSMSRVQSSVEDMNSSITEIDKEVHGINNIIGEVTEAAAAIAESGTELQHKVNDNMEAVDRSLTSIHVLNDVINQFTLDE